MDTFLTGTAANPTAMAARKVGFGAYFDTYNRTDLQERVQDIATGITYLRGRYHKGVALVGTGKAGTWALMAAPLADGTAVDVNHFDTRSDAGYVTEDMYVPCLRHFGDFKTAATLAAPRPLALYNVDDGFDAANWISKAYSACGAGKHFSVSSTAPSNDDLTTFAAIVASGGSR